MNGTLMEAIPDVDNTLLELALQRRASPAVAEEATRCPPPEKNHGRFKVRPLEAASNDRSSNDSLNQDQKREDRVKKKVSFPEGEALIKGYAHAPNPWYNVTQCTPENLVAAYTTSCEKHSVKPIQKLVSQLRRIQDFTERVSLLELRGENVSLKHVETLEEIFKRIQFILIDLESCHLDDESSTALFDMVEYYESAMQLKVSGNRSIGARGWTACARMIRKTPCLETLDTRGCTFGEQGLPALGRALRMGAHVTVLHMEDCGLASRGVMILAAALRMSDTLHELYLGDNSLQAADGLQLGNLVRNNTALRLLDLRNNHLQDTGAAHIFDALACQAAFDQRTGLQQGFCGEHLPRAAQRSLLNQGQGRGLHILVLCNNGLTYHSMPPLAAALTRTTVLQTINLGQNNLTDEGIFVLKDGLLQNKSIANLFLPLTKISCEGAVALAEYIADSTNIRHLDLKENDIKTAGLLALSMCVKVQRTVVQMDLDTSPKKESAIKDYANQQRGFLEEIAAQLQHNRDLEAERLRQAAAAREMADTATEEPQPPAADDDGHDACVSSHNSANTARAKDPVSLLPRNPNLQRGFSGSHDGASEPIQSRAADEPVQSHAADELQLAVHNLAQFELNGSDNDVFECNSGAAPAVSAVSRYGSTSLRSHATHRHGILPGHVDHYYSAYPGDREESHLTVDLTAGDDDIVLMEETVLYDSRSMIRDLEVTLINASTGGIPHAECRDEAANHMALWDGRNVVAAHSSAACSVASYASPGSADVDTFKQAAEEQRHVAQSSAGDASDTCRLANSTTSVPASVMAVGEAHGVRELPSALPEHVLAYRDIQEQLSTLPALCKSNPSNADAMLLADYLPSESMDDVSVKKSLFASTILEARCMTKVLQSNDERVLLAKANSCPASLSNESDSVAIRENGTSLMQEREAGSNCDGTVEAVSSTQLRIAGHVLPEHGNVKITREKAWEDAVEEETMQGSASDAEGITIDNPRVATDHDSTDQRSDATLNALDLAGAQVSGSADRACDSSVEHGSAPSPEQDDASQCVVAMSPERGNVVAYNSSVVPTVSGHHDSALPEGGSIAGHGSVAGYDNGSANDVYGCCDPTLTRRTSIAGHCGAASTESGCPAVQDDAAQRACGAKDCVLLEGYVLHGHGDSLASCEPLNNRTSSLDHAAALQAELALSDPITIPGISGTAAAAPSSQAAAAVDTLETNAAAVFSAEFVATAASVCDAVDLDLDDGVGGKISSYGNGLSEYLALADDASSLRERSPAATVTDLAVDLAPAADAVTDCYADAAAVLRQSCSVRPCDGEQSFPSRQSKLLSQLHFDGHAAVPAGLQRKVPALSADSGVPLEGEAVSMTVGVHPAALRAATAFGSGNFDADACASSDSADRDSGGLATLTP